MAILLKKSTLNVYDLEETFERRSKNIRLCEAYDIEATGKNPYKGAKTFAYATCNNLGEYEVLRFDGVNGGKNEARHTAYLMDSSIAKVCHNFHYEYAMALEAGIDVPEDTIWHDTMLLSQLFDNLADGHGLDDVSLRLMPDPTTREYWKRIDKEVERAALIYKNYKLIPKDLMTEYQTNDVVRTMLVFETLYPIIKADPRLHADYLNEIETVKATIRQERRGIMLERKEAKKLINWMEDELAEIDRTSYRLLGRVINFKSAPQIRHLLYNELKLPVQLKTMGKSKGNVTADKDAIEALRDIAPDEFTGSILDLILKQRSYTKGISMVQSYLDAALIGDIIHPRINTNRAQTGRESSEDPNMQNISKDAALKTRFPVPARKCFRARPGYVLFLVDYAGIEMRLIIEHTREPEMLALIQRNGDPHDLAASLFYGERYTDHLQACKYIATKDKKFKQKWLTALKEGIEKAVEECWPKAKKIFRGAAKNAQFALAYGARLPKIAETLMMTKEEAEPGYNAYCKRFPLIANFTNNMKAQINAQGFVVTSFGRKLNVRKDKPYSASNYIIQGTAAGILKRAQVRVSEYLKNMDIHLLLPIHDELIIEFPRTLLSQAPKILSKISKIMTEMSEITVPLDVEWKMTTYTWDRAKEFKYDHN